MTRLSHSPSSLLPPYIPLVHAGEKYAVQIKASRQAKKFTLRLQVNRGPRPKILLTVPRNASLMAVQRFLHHQTSWLFSKIATRPPDILLIPHNILLFRGIPHRIVWQEFAPDFSASYPFLTPAGGPHYFPYTKMYEKQGPTLSYIYFQPVLPLHKDVLPLAIEEKNEEQNLTLHVETAQGAHSHDPREICAISRNILLYLKKMAFDALHQSVQTYAKRIHKPSPPITLRDTISRWGSCSHKAHLSFSWRLIFAPDFVLDYIAAHEVAHLCHMDHSEQFWQLTQQLAPYTEEAEAWLKQHGALLHRYQGARRER